jgi:hypothetical protein
MYEIDGHQVDPARATDQCINGGVRRAMGSEPTEREITNMVQRVRPILGARGWITHEPNHGIIRLTDTAREYVREVVAAAQADLDNYRPHR